MQKTLNVFSYNIHKGFTVAKRRYIFEQMREALHDVHPDIVFLQELHGQHPEDYMEENGDDSPLEAFADTLWPHHAYGKNAAYTKGHHGNAILSKHPFKFWENLNISTNRFERRGLLHGIVSIKGLPKDLHLFCVHLNLLEGGRKKQLQTLIERISTHVDSDSPFIIAGDFNDWRENATEWLQTELGLQEACLSFDGQHGKTFPSWRPVLPLDRIYFRGLMVVHAKPLVNPPWNRLSDHAPLLAQLKF